MKALIITSMLLASVVCSSVWAGDSGPKSSSCSDLSECSSEHSFSDFKIADEIDFASSKGTTPYAIQDMLESESVLAHQKEVFSACSHRNPKDFLKVLRDQYCLFVGADRESCLEKINTMLTFNAQDNSFSTDAIFDPENRDFYRFLMAESLSMHVVSGKGYESHLQFVYQEIKGMQRDLNMRLPLEKRALQKERLLIGAAGLGIGTLITTLLYMYR